MPTTKKTRTSSATKVPETSAVTVKKVRTRTRTPRQGAVAPLVVRAPEEPSYETVAVRAYELYLGRGGAHGCDVEDWLQAERELRDA
ncbi:MAG: DUF2934 domain-containing protein [Deltaproteobacteria bacterium]|nr:DUF2934 domain-containing protein [Deltaproteobacteria bacterium]